MKLFYRKHGQGQALIILHGLFGQCDNWNTLGKKFSELFEVYLVDQRNHGLSPHSDVWTYESMSADLLELITDNNLTDVLLIGHSMGGKAIMDFASRYPEYIDKMIVSDIAPKAYPVHQQDVIMALNSVDFEVVKSRKQVEDILAQRISDFGTRQFLLKNLYWIQENRLAWRFNLEVISKNIEEIGKESLAGKVCETNTLFMRGAKSNYITDSDLEEIIQKFPHAKVSTIPNAGHWIHAEQPQLFYEAAMEYFRS